MENNSPRAWAIRLAGDLNQLRGSKSSEAAVK